MKNKIKRFLTAALAGMLTIGIGTAPTVFAAGIGNQGFIETEDNVLTIPKGISLFNEETGNFYMPAVNYTFTAEPATPPTGAKAGNSEVLAGPANSVSVTGTPQFAAGLYAMSPAGVETAQNLSLAVDASKFTKPGIYRYLITDTTPIADLYAAGIERSTDYQATRYLDVFVERDTDTTFKVYGYVLMKNNPLTNETGVIQKSIGFIKDDEAGRDTFTTYNVTLEKDVEGALGDRAHEWPFAITVGNGTNTYFWAKNDTDIANYTSSATTQLTSANLKHGDKIYIKGLSPHATVAYTETIDVNDIYQVKASGTGNAVLVAEAPKTNGGTTVLAATAVTNYETANSATSITAAAAQSNVKDVVFTNTMDTVSPTGLALRFAPYAFALLFGLVLIAIGTKKEEENAKA